MAAEAHRRPQHRRQPRLKPAAAHVRALCCALLAISAAGLAAGASTAGAKIYLRATSAPQNGSGATSLTVTVPAAAVANDLLIVSVNSAGSSSFTAPGGWTQLSSGAAGYGWAATYWRIATAGDAGTNYTWGLGSSAVKAAGGIWDYVGVSTASPIGPNTLTGGFGATSGAAPSVTTAIANSLVQVGAAVGATSGPVTFTAPGGVTNFGSVNTSGAGSVIATDSGGFTQAVAGATGAKTFSWSKSGNWATQTIAISPGTGALAFGVAPALPSTLGTIALNGQAQTKTAAMNNFDVDDTTGSGSGWNVTVNGDSSAGHSAVFKRYCPNAGGCGADAFGYVTGGATLSAGSLSLNSTGASFTTGWGTGSAPTLKCGSGCALDTSAATKVASAAAAAGLGPWATSGFGASSLSLAAPTTTRALPASEVYHVDLVWTLNSGP